MSEAGEEGALSMLFQPRRIASLSDQFPVTTVLLSCPFGIGPCEYHPTHKTLFPGDISTYLWSIEGRVPAAVFIESDLPLLN